jgi:histidine ammonia-lyase
MDLLGHDLLQASFWIDVRKKEDPKRDFGKAPTEAWSALRKAVPPLTAEQ